ncbi:MAG: hypothetical protein OJF49_002375 [Ktedonobacterales bacterium]|nr:MAG: hypothetical protein OJF49_002375 [Ktedonobacterales bacterium]
METATETKVQRVGLSRASLSIIVLGLIALAIPIGYTLFASASGNVTLASADDITNLLRNGLVLTVVAAALGVLGLLLHLLANGIRKIIQMAFSVLVIVAALVFLFVMVLPRVNTIQNLNDKIVPFATTMRDYCQTPLNQTHADLLDALNRTQGAADDATFAAAMQSAVTALQKDSTDLTNALTKLNATTAPDSKYQDLLNDCKATVQAQNDFLSNPNGANAIPLPPPFNALAAKVDGIDLLKNSGAIAAGLAPLKVPAGTMEPLVAQALTQVVSVTNPKLTAEGDQLSNDISDTLTNNLAPFKVDTASIVG